MTISRATLPVEFYDRTSALMLKQPEPQYLWARLVMMADASAELRRGAASGTSRALVESGANVPDLAEMQLLLSDDIRGEAIFTSDELAPGKEGHTIRLNRPVFSGGGYTEAERTIAANTSISTTGIDLSMEQVAITIKRVAGPFAANGTVVQPYPIDKFDAQHSIHSLVQTVGLNLQRDRTKYLDKIISALYDLGSVKVFPGDSGFQLTTDAGAFTANVNGDRPMDLETIFRAEEKLETLNIPRFANGKYLCVLSPQQSRQLRSDPLLNKQAVFETQKNPLNTSFIATIGGVEVYVSNTQAIDTSTVSGVSIHHGVMFGPGAVGRAGSGPCEVASANEDNYGQTAKVIWLAHEGHSVLDNRFIVNIHSN